MTTGDILGPSEKLRAGLGYVSGTPRAGELLERLAALRPALLGCMHGLAWEGDGAALLRALGEVLAGRVGEAHP